MSILTDDERKALDEMDDHTLIEMWQTYTDIEARHREGRNYAEYLLTARMIDRDADAVPSMTHDIKLTHPYDTDADKLTPLGELVDPEMIRAAYTAPAQVWTSEKWNMTVLNSWRKFGGEVRSIIDGSKIYRPPRISIRKKGVK